MKRIENKTSESEQPKRKSLGIKKDKVIFPVAHSISEMPDGYLDFIQQIKNAVSQQRLKALVSANASMIVLYWEIGNSILQQQLQQGWGAKVIDRMSVDLKNEFPEISGFSPRNLKYMRKFAEAWPDLEIVQRTVALIPWRSNITLLDKLNEPELRLWYAQKTVENGFGKDVLVFQIETQLHKRQGAAINNFNNALPPAESDFTTQIFKDPYIFDFLGTANTRREAELEQKLIDHIQKFLLELGQGFAFVGRQVHLELGDSDFYLDLLFYHLKLRCFVVVELKTGEFEPGFVSKLNMYMNVVDDVLKHPDDKKTIGLLLVKSKNKTVVEYSLAGYTNPIGVANWEKEILKTLPENLKSSLPSIEEIENELMNTEITE
jgi:predicted nuclease of restriction endonuclease-like (RecB) superfamily